MYMDILATFMFSLIETKGEKLSLEIGSYSGVKCKAIWQSCFQDKMRLLNLVNKNKGTKYVPKMESR